MPELVTTMEELSEDLLVAVRTLLDGDIYEAAFKDQLRTGHIDSIAVCRAGSSVVGVGLIEHTPEGKPSVKVMVPAETVDIVEVTASIIEACEPLLAEGQWWVQGRHIESARDAANRRGHVLVRLIDRMERALHNLPNAEVAVTRAYLPNDASDVVEINNAAFASHPDRSAWTEKDVQKTFRALGDRYEDLLLSPVEEPDGFCWLKRHSAEHGEVFVLAAHPRAQGTGLGARLLQAGLIHLRDDPKATTAMLYVERSNKHAIALYERFGFSDVQKSLAAFTVQTSTPTSEPIK